MRHTSVAAVVATMSSRAYRQTIGSSPLTDVPFRFIHPSETGISLVSHTIGSRGIKSFGIENCRRLKSMRSGATSTDSRMKSIYPAARTDRVPGAVYVNGGDERQRLRCLQLTDTTCLGFSQLMAEAFAAYILRTC